MAAKHEQDPATLPSHEVERLLARHYWEQGFEVEPGGTASTGSRFEGGVDLVLRRDGETRLVQCKHWKTAPVPVEDVQQLLGLLDSRQAQRGILVAGGEFSETARAAAAASGRIELVDGAALRAIVGPPPVPTSRLWWLMIAGLLVIAGFVLAPMLYP